MTTQNLSSTRERLIDATVSLMRTKGAAASGTKEILDLAGAPRGSFYFHFPDGKDQLVLAALERAAAATLLALTEPFTDDAGNLGDQMRAIFTAIEADLLAHDYGPGCAVAVTTMESASTFTQFQQAVSAAFASWTSALTNRLTQRGVSPDRAAPLADAIVAATEGATILARAHRSPTPLRNAALMLELAVDAVVRESSDTKPAVPSKVRPKPQR
jgi:TetR/AcrR family transcriptional repressor of lmrAB and yxaGH operons